MTNTQLSRKLSAVFRTAFETHPQRKDDPGLALASAQEDVLDWLRESDITVIGTFDDVALTFTVE